MHPDTGLSGSLPNTGLLIKPSGYVIQPKTEDFSDIHLALTKDAIRPLTDTKYDDKKKDGMSINSAQVQQHASTVQRGYNMATGTSQATNVI